MDMVFTYVDGSDPRHVARRAATRRALPEMTPERPVWYSGVGEITYAVRSVLAAMPWIGTIHIVTDDQLPPVDTALIETGRVRVVDHRDIVPEPYRPVFASTIIESFLHRIPGLSDVWLYDNDDFLHGGSVAPEEFLEEAPDGVRLRLRTVPALVRVAIAGASDLSPAILPRANPYTCGIRNSALLLRRRIGLPWSDIVFPRHVTQVYRTATARRLEDLLPDELHAARSCHFRGTGQLSWSTLAYSAECHWNAARRRRHGLLSQRADEAFFDFARFGRSSARSSRLADLWERVVRSRAAFICLNNIPVDQADAFRAAMVRRGLGGPPAATYGRVPERGKTDEYD